MAVATGHHPATISRMWREHGLTPHRVKPFTLSTDFDFVAQLRDVVGLYLHPRERAVVNDPVCRAGCRHGNDPAEKTSRCP